MLSTVITTMLQGLLALRVTAQQDHHDELVAFGASAVNGYRDERRVQAFSALTRQIDEAIKYLQQSVATLAQIDEIDHPTTVETPVSLPTESEIIQQVKRERDAALARIKELEVEL